MADNSVELSLAPSDNTRLANLCGAMDENISHIARALSVKIKRRGGRFQVLGEAAQQAADALSALYAIADRGVADDDVRLQLAQPLPGAGAAAAAASAAPAPAPLPAGFQPRSESQRQYWEKIHRHSVTLCLGPAGTGKTHIAVAAALQLLRGSAAVQRLVLSRPVVEAGGERLGFLPGDMEQKVNPYLQPLYDILYQLLGQPGSERMMASGKIGVIPLAFMRGLTLGSTVLILDEAQNTTPAQMKMLLTRLGDNGKMIIAGDVSQSDIAAPPVSGLADAAARLDGIAGIAIHRFKEGDIVRHPLVRDILAAYGKG